MRLYFVCSVFNFAELELDEIWYVYIQLLILNYLSFQKIHVQRIYNHWKQKIVMSILMSVHFMQTIYLKVSYIIT